jgi:hypothetical protein
MFIGITHEIFELVTNKQLYEIFGGDCFMVCEV